jgi:hypothetical protein
MLVRRNELMPYSRIAGDFTPGIYTEDCSFEDPTIKFCGSYNYSLVEHIQYSPVQAYTLKIAFDW